MNTLLRTATVPQCDREAPDSLGTYENEVDGVTSCFTFLHIFMVRLFILRIEKLDNDSISLLSVHMKEF